MKWFPLLVLLAAPGIAAVNPQLKQVNTIYILSMGGGMDQFLANQMTAMGVFQVVTDPQKADAVITDRLGEAFEDKLNELYPSAPAKGSAAAADKNSEDTGAARTSSLGRGRGNYYIVDRKTRTVLWSVYELPKDSTPPELTRTARKIVQRLKNDLTEKKPKAE